MFKCTDCGKTVRKVSDVRDCQRCGTRASASIPAHHNDSDFLTPALIGYLVGQSFSHHDAPAAPDNFSGGGGDYSGAGASSSWDSGSSGGSSDSGSSYDSSSSSDSGGSSSSSSD